MADAAVDRAKRPAEEFVVSWDFVDDLAAGDGVKAIGATDADSHITAVQVDTGEDVSDDFLEGETQDGTTLRAQVQGGTAGKDYDVTFSAKTSVNGDRWERVVRVRVRA